MGSSRAVPLTWKKKSGDSKTPYFNKKKKPKKKLPDLSQPNRDNCVVEKMWAGGGGWGGGGGWWGGGGGCGYAKRGRSWQGGKKGFGGGSKTH